MTDNITIFECVIGIDIGSLEDNNEEEEIKKHVDAVDLLNEPNFEYGD